MSRFDRRMRGLRPNDSTEKRSNRRSSTNNSTNSNNVNSIIQPRQTVQTNPSNDGLRQLSVNGDKNTRIMASHEIRLNEIDENIKAMQSNLEVAVTKNTSNLANHDKQIQTMFLNVNKFNTILDGFRRFEKIVYELKEEVNANKVTIERLTAENTDLKNMLVGRPGDNKETQTETQTEETQTETQTEETQTETQTTETETQTNETETQTTETETQPQPSISDISEKEIKDEINNELKKQENIHVEILEKTKKEETGIHDVDEIKELVSKTLHKKLSSEA